MPSSRMPAVVFCAVFLFLVGSAASGAPVRAGAGLVVITPASPPQEQLEVNALVIEAGGAVAAFCAVDTGAVSQVLVNAVSQRLSAVGSFITAETLMLSATHTHTGAYAGMLPGAIQESAYGAFNQANVDACADNVVAALRTAELALEPARLLFAHGDVPACALNRSFPGNPIDTTLSALRVENSGGCVLGYLINYAAHPTILSHGPGTPPGGPGRDFPMGISWELREAAGAAVPVVFMNGALGNVGPNPPTSVTTRRGKAEAMGREIAQAALGLLTGAPALNDTTISCRTRQVPLYPSLLETVAPQTACLQDFHIGSAVFLSLPGEPCGQLGLALRAKGVATGAQHVFLGGLTSDYVGYMPNDEEWFGALYESEMCFFGPLMIRWYAENHLPEHAAPAVADLSGVVAREGAAYDIGLSQGLRDAERFAGIWAVHSALLDSIVPLIPSLMDLPTAIEQLIATLPPEDTARVAKQYAAYYVRQMFAPAHTDAMRAKLMGLADGSGLPVDVFMLLQFLAQPIGLTPPYDTLIQQLGLTGFDFAQVRPDFTAFLTQGKAPLRVTFENASDPGLTPVTAWAWDFGDGETGSGPRPEHEYLLPGTYSVSLTVTDGNGEHTVTKESLITVAPRVPAVAPLGLTVLVLLLAGYLVRHRVNVS